MSQTQDFGEVRNFSRGNDPDYLYYNAQIINNSTSTVTVAEDPDIRFQDTRSIPILQDKSNFAISVENFTINGAGKNLPVFIPQIRQFDADGSVNTNPNNTIYDVTVTIQYGGTKENPTQVYQSTRSVQWIPENQAVWTKQPSPLGEYRYPQEEIPYYYCYTYSHWVKLVNSALALAWADVCSSALNGGVPSLTIVINSLSGTTITLVNTKEDPIRGTFVKGAFVTKINSGEEALAQISSLSPFVLNIVSGTFNEGDQIQQDNNAPDQPPNTGLATATIASAIPSTFTVGGQVKCFNPTDLVTPTGTGTVVSFEGNTLILYDISGIFEPGYIVDGFIGLTNTGTASITTVSNIDTIVVPAITLGTKCPFYTYDPITNLFSLWQDSNTCVTPFGQPVSSPPYDYRNPPNAQEVFGVSTATGYQPGEYSFIGYNTNFESLFTNFNTTYYSTQRAYPYDGKLGVVINSPIGNEVIGQNTIVNQEVATITSFIGDQMGVSWSSETNVPGSNWIFAIPELKSTSTVTTGPSVSTLFELVTPIAASYIKVGLVMDVTDNVSKRVVTGIITLITGSPITSLTLELIPGTSVFTSSNWTLSFSPLTSTTQATPVAGTPLSLVTNLDVNQSLTQVNHVVTVTGPNGQSFDGIVSSYEQVLGYTGASGGYKDLIYDNASVPSGFNPIMQFQAQVGLFGVNDVLIGQSSNATGQVIDILEGNSGLPNTISIYNQIAPFEVGSLVGVNGTAASALVTSIAGPNLPQSGTIINHTGFATIAETYIESGLIGYAGPFNVGDTLVGSGSNGIITAVAGDNGYTRLSVSAQKNPFVIGKEVNAFASIDNTSTSLCYGVIDNIIGENTGYGTMNITNQNGKFGVGEVIVDVDNNAVATIVNIAGTNNGYGTLAYINQTTTGAPGSFIPGEFLLFSDTLDAFAKVILDTQNVLNPTEGNIGSVTVITGVEQGGIFTPTSNVPLPGSGSQIVGSESGTVADFGGIVYNESAVLTLSNIAGTFNIEDPIVSNVGYGLPSSSTTISVTATCNGMAYLGNVELILRNTEAGPSGPKQFNTTNLIIDVGNTSNTVALVVTGIPPNRQFLNGDPVSSGPDTGTVLINCGPVPYPSTDTSTQLITVLPNPGSQFQVGDVLQDAKQVITLRCNPQNVTGFFLPGDEVSNITRSGTGFIQSTVPDYPNLVNTIYLQDITGTFEPGDNIQTLTPNIGVTQRIMSNYSGTTGQFTDKRHIFSPGDSVFNWRTNSYETVASHIIIQRLTVDGVTGFVESNTIPITQGYTSNGYILKIDAPDTLYVQLTNRSIGSYGDPYNIDFKISSVSGPLKQGQATTGCTAASIYSTNLNFVEGSNIQSGDPMGLIFDFSTSGLQRTSGVYGAEFVLPAVYPAFAEGAPFYLWTGSNTSEFKPSYLGKITYSQTVYISNKQYTQISAAFSSWDATLGNVNVGNEMDCNFELKYSTHIKTKTLLNVSANIAEKDDVSVWPVVPYYSAFYADNKNNKTSAQTQLTGVTLSSDISGTIAQVITSSSSAIVQTSEPPSNPTTLTLTNVTGMFTEGELVSESTSLGQIQSYVDTTDYVGVPSNLITTLTVKNVIDYESFSQNISIVEGSNTATILSSSFQNGQLIVKPINGTFIANEFLTDVASQATATYISQTNQIITGEFSDAKGQVTVDNGINLSFIGITGTFQVGETIVSTVGTQAEIVGESYFGIGEVLDVTSGASATIVSDNGSEIVIKSVNGVFSAGDTFTSSGATGTIISVSDSVLNIIPTTSTGESDSWVIVPSTLTSATQLTPPTDVLFTTNLTVNESIFDDGDTLAIAEVDSVLTIDQLYYPENVVDVDLSAGNYAVKTLQSLFPSATAGTQYVVLTQDFESTSSLWSPVASIVVGTQFITVREEYSGTPITIGSGNLGSNASSGSFQKVLLETPIEVLPQSSWRGLIFYEQKVEKLSSLGMSKEDLKNLDVQIYWRNRLTNSLTPLTLYNGGSANIRVLFKKIHDN